MNDTGDFTKIQNPALRSATTSLVWEYTVSTMQAKFLFFVFICSSVFLAPAFVRADAASDIQAQIETNRQQLAALEAEIAEYQKQVDVLGSKKNTLQSAINSLALSQKQLATQIKATQNKIDSANLKIRELSYSIGDKEESIAVDKDAIARALRSVAERERVSLITNIISADSFGTVWRAVDESVQFNRALGEDIESLRAVRTELSVDREKETIAKASLVKLQNDLAVQKRSVDANRSAQEQLLAQTKNQEANYQKLIAEKEAQESAFEDELIALQSQLDLIVHPGSLPKVGTGILSWPFTNAFMFNCAERKKVFGNTFCITQYFGNTPFSTANPQVYNGHGHNAIDIGSPNGTPVLSALSGTVLATGNTDLAHDSQGRQCYSFGKWIMIDHHNGLNTMYSHLSVIDVSKGQSVKTGQVIGLSGTTGYATGPHLHFGVYATEGTKIMTLGEFKGTSGTRCANATMPVASIDAYLNPLSYL